MVMIMMVMIMMMIMMMIVTGVKVGHNLIVGRLFVVIFHFPTHAYHR